MYCVHCGKEIGENAVICTQCGCPTELFNKTQTTPQQQNTYSPLSIVGFVLAFFMAIAGLICSIIAYKSACAENSEKSKTLSKAGIIVSSVLIGLGILYVIIIIPCFVYYGYWLFY